MVLAFYTLCNRKNTVHFTQNRSLYEFAVNDNQARIGFAECINYAARAGDSGGNTSLSAAICFG